MEGNPQAPERKKWPGRMALFFTFLFAILWSLGAFFFWTTFLLAIYFAFLHFYYSDTLKRWMDGFTSSYRPPPGPTPYQSFGSRPPQPPTDWAKVKGTIQVVVVVAGLILLFAFLYGLFSRVEDFVNASESTTDPTEMPQEENGGTTPLLEKGNAALNNEKPDSALYYYDQVLAIDPENVYGLYNTGLAYLIKNDFRKANKFQRRCVRYHGDYDPAWWLLGYGYDKLSETDSALYSLEQAYQHDYSQPEFLQLLSDVYLKKGNRNKALEVYKKMYALDTTKTDLLRKMMELDPSNSDKYQEKIRALGN